MSIQPQILKDKGKNNVGKNKQKNKLQNHEKSGEPKKIWRDKHQRESAAASDQGGQPQTTDLQCGEVDEDVSVQSAWPQQSIVQNVSSVGGCQDDDMVGGAHS